MTSEQQFESWFSWVMAWEGVTFEEVAGDSGGPTEFGIDQRSHPGTNIKGLTLAQARAIYWAHWDKSLARSLPQPVGITWFDAAENCGESASTKQLQRSLGVADDGQFGPVSFRSLEGWMNTALIVDKQLDERSKYYDKLVEQNPKKFKRFLAGWKNRISSLREKCVDWQ